MATRSERSEARAKFIAERARIRNMLLRKRRRVPIKYFLTTCLEMRNWVRRYESKTAFNLAAARGFLSLVKIMMDRGVPIDAEAIALAAEYGHLKVVRYLLDRGAPIDEYAISEAAFEGHVGVVRLMLDHRVPIDSEAIAWAVTGGHLEIVRLLLDRGAPFDERAIRRAARCRHFEIEWALRAHLDARRAEKEEV